MTSPDTTPSADARELYAGRNAGSEYGGDVRWRSSGSVGVSQAVSFEKLESDNPESEQQSLFGDNLKPALDSATPPQGLDGSTLDRYGHVQGASAKVLRESDQEYFAELARRTGRI